VAIFLYPTPSTLREIDLNQCQIFGTGIYSDHRNKAQMDRIGAKKMIELPEWIVKRQALWGVLILFGLVSWMVLSGFGH
jgi:hypothetical protein